MTPELRQLDSHLAFGENGKVFMARYIRNNKSACGMSWMHDVPEGVGGHPYKSVTPQDVCAAFAEHGFVQVRAFKKSAAIQGLFGSHCDEFFCRASDMSRSRF